jgi:hypothetical protein
MQYYLKKIFYVFDIELVNYISILYKIHNFYEIGGINYNYA